MEVNRVKISKCISMQRLDPIFYRYGILRFDCRYKMVTIASVVISMQSGFAAGKSNQSDNENGIIQIRPTNIDSEGNLILDKVIFVPSRINKPKLEMDDIVFNNTNSQELVGKTSIFKENEPMFFSNHITRIKVNKEFLIPDYLFIVLNIYQREKIFYSICTNWNNQSGVNTELLKSVQIPLPPLSGQQEIVDIHNQAQKKKQEKEKEAQRLLDSIDTYLLKELGIELPDEPEKELSFTVRIAELLGGKFDVKSTKNKEYRIVSKKYQEFDLGEISLITKGQSITKGNITEGEYPVIAGGQTSPYSHNTYNQNENAITISASGAYAGFVWYHNYKFFASDCIVIRSIDEEQILTPFLYEVLKLKQQKIYMLQRGAGQPHVYPDDISRIKIPNISISKQRDIIDYTNLIRNKAKQLQEEALSLIQETKQKIEKIILN